jgi:uncharacterized protein YegL
MKTLILILLDESGSMDSQKGQVISGFNKFIQDQKAIKEDEAWVTFLKFNTLVKVVLKCEPVSKVPGLEFFPNGGTSLFDAIWEGVQIVEGMEGLFDRVVYLILTDGEDNSSRKITSEGVGSLIKKKEGEGKWTFLYIGQNPDRWAKETGMSLNNAAAYNHTMQAANFCQAQMGVQNIRQQPMPQMPNAFFNNRFPSPPAPLSPPSINKVD